MIFTKAKNYEEITEKLDKENDVISLIGCETCVRVAGSGGEKRLIETGKRLKEDGYNVLEGYLVPAACTPKIFPAQPDRKVNTIISLACGAGSANLRRTFCDYKVIETITDIGLMCEDSDKEILKITRPVTEPSMLGKEFRMHTGEKLSSDDNINLGEVEA